MVSTLDRRLPCFNAIRGLSWSSTGAAAAAARASGFNSKLCLCIAICGCRAVTTDGGIMMQRFFCRRCLAVAYSQHGGACPEKVHTRCVRHARFCHAGVGQVPFLFRCGAGTHVQCQMGLQASHGRPQADLCHGEDEPKSGQGKLQCTPMHQWSNAQMLCVACLGLTTVL